MRLSILGFAVLGAVSCATDRELVSNSLASRHYEASRCARLCCEPGTGVYDEAKGVRVPCAPLLAGAPEACPAWKRDLNTFLDEVEFSREAAELGRLPKNARKRLKATQAQAEREGKP